MGICEIENPNPNNISMESNKNFHRVIPSVCLIETLNESATGFFIKLNNNFFCLMTNEHVIEEKMIESKEEVEVRYDYGNKHLKINLEQSKRIIEYDKKKDITIIQILAEDNIDERYFLSPYQDKIFIHQKIYIVQYPRGQLYYSEGNITNINKDELTYSSSTDLGSSGSPIFLYDSLEVIGIHKKRNKTKLENCGIMIFPIRQEFINRKYIKENGEYYNGQRMNNLKHGKGKIYYKNGNIKYEGDFVNDKYDGYGKYFWENGEYYIGNWMNGLKYGKGKEYYKNGSIKYDGDFVNDKYEGYGKYIYENGEYYNGQWMNDLKYGKGKEYYKNGNLKYEGDFVNDKYEGIGKYYWENGEYYILEIG